MNRTGVLLFLALNICTTYLAAQVQPESVFHSTSGNRHWHAHQDNHRALYKVITRHAYEKLNERRERISAIKTEAEWQQYISNLKNNFGLTAASFDETPLNAKVTGILEREKFTVEKIVFESQPGFFVTAALFLPKTRQQPAPAVIYACGHTELGFRSDTYQHVILNLVDKGFIVLAFDPLGQGERLQYPDKETGKSQIGGPTTEHSYAGVQTLLKGMSISDYFIWDGIRVVDYLETRPEIDMKRIGMTGRSGGGTQTAQIASCDERIYAAAPENYITSFSRLLQSIGPQDAEQNPYRFIMKGFDHADYIHVRAPKPMLMLTTTNDIFSIQGARETFAEAQLAYSAMGQPGNLRMTEDDGKHESTKKNREALYAFFQEHLRLPGDSTDNETTPFSLEELQVTPTGQVATSYNSETVFSLNQKYLPGTPRTGIEEQVTYTAGIDLNRKLKSAVYTGNFYHNGIKVQKYFLENNLQDYALPVYLAEGENAGNGKIVVWLHPEGKQQVLNERLLIELINKGFIVVTADLPGTGELHDPKFTGDAMIKGIPYNYVFGANLVGKSIPGIMAEGIDMLVQFLESDNRLKDKPIETIVSGTAASAFMHYSILQNKFNKAAFIDFPESSKNLVNEKFYNPSLAFHMPPGSLNHYDLPGLMEHLVFFGMKVHYSNNDIGGIIRFLSE